MSLPDRAERTVTIDAPPDVVYDLVSDVSRMGQWSPECSSCEWLDEPGKVGSKFRGHNRRGLARWSTTAQLLVADRPWTFTFATLHRDQVATRWNYSLEGDERTHLTESFEAVTAPWLISLAERLFIRDRQQQLEEGISRTLEAIKAAAEAADPI